MTVWDLRRNYTKSLLTNPLVAEVWRLEKGNSMLTKAFIAELESASGNAPPVFMGGAQDNDTKPGEATS